MADKKGWLSELGVVVLSIKVMVVALEHITANVSSCTRGCKGGMGERAGTTYRFTFLMSTLPLDGTGDIGIIFIGVGAEPGIILLNSCVANRSDLNLGINGGEEKDSFYRSEKGGNLHIA